MAPLLSGAPPEAAPENTARARIALSALFAATLLIAAVGYAAGQPAMRLAGLFGALVFGVGTAPLALSRTQGFAARAGFGCLFGISLFLAVGSLMVLVPVWAPVEAAALLGSVAIGLHVAGLRAALREEPHPLRGLRTRILAERSTLSAACTLVGTAIWLTSALSTPHIVPANWGFLTKITPAWYVGILIVLAGLAFARRAREPYAIFAVISLVAAIKLTPALVYGEPGSQSADKHIVLVQLILQTHFLNIRADLYDAYSGFFAAIAWLCDVGDIHNSLGLATFWPFVAGLARLSLLRWMFAPLIRSRYRIWSAITLVILVDAIGSDYFSPQSIGYLIGLGVFALVMNYGEGSVGDRLRIATLLLAGCALAVTHELSPFIIGGVLVVLAVFNILRPRWAAATILVPAFAWSLINKSVLGHFFTLSDLGNISNFSPPRTVTAPGLARSPIIADSTRALLLGVLILLLAAAVGWLRNRRNRTAWACIIAPSVGLLFVAVNPYGNEGIFRATLFAIPWLAVLAAGALRRRPSRWMSLVFAPVTAVLLATFLIASYALDGFDVIRQSDLNGLAAFQRQAPWGSYFLDLGDSDVPGFVPSSGEHYEYIDWQVLLTEATGLAGPPTPYDMRFLATRYRTYAENHYGDAPYMLYALWSPTSVVFSVDYGALSASDCYDWLHLMLHSPQWTLVYRSGGSYVFRTPLHVGHKAPRTQQAKTRVPAHTHTHTHKKR